MGGVGYFKGNLPSLIYDRTRVWVAMVLLLMLLHRYKVSSSELVFLLKPVFYASIVGYPLAVIFPPANDFGWVRISDTLGFNSMTASYGVGCLLVYRRFNWWLIPGLLSAFIVPIYLAERAKFIAILFGLLMPFFRSFKRNVIGNTLLVFILIGSISTIVFNVGSAEQSENKKIAGSGLKIESLFSTTESRYKEREALIDQMEGLEYLIGKGTGSIWDGSNLYISEVGIDRQNFHIYYFEIIYWHGFIGLLLFVIVVVYPFVNSLLNFNKLSEVGVMGLCCLGAILVSWFGHAGYTMSEGSLVAVSLYALKCGRNKLSES